jgi:hypothetical protein
VRGAPRRFEIRLDGAKFSGRENFLPTALRSSPAKAMNQRDVPHARVPAHALTREMSKRGLVLWLETPQCR